MASSSFFLLILNLILVSSLLPVAAAVRPIPLPAASKMSLDGRSHFMLPKRGSDPLAKFSPGGNAVTIIHGGDDTLATSEMSLEGMHPKKSLDYNPIARSPQGGNAVSITPGHSYIPGEDQDARWSPSPPPPSAYVVESEPPSKPSPPTCLPIC